MKLQKMNEVFMDDRPCMWDNNTEERLLGLLLVEVGEFSQAFINYMAEKSEKNKVDVIQESADIVLFLCSIATRIGFDLEDETRSKVAYNSDRFRNVHDDFNAEYKQAKANQKPIKDIYYPELV